MILFNWARPIFDWLNDFIVPRKLAYVHFHYESKYMRQSPVRKEHVVLAKVRKTATPDEVVQKLFTIKPTDKKTTFKVVDVKIFPVVKMPKV